MAAAIGRRKARSGTVPGAGGRSPKEACGWRWLKALSRIPMRICAAFSG